MRASSRLSLEEGMATSWCWALAALRRRVRKSATGSVIDMRSPTGFRHPGDVAVVGQLAQADPAQPKFLVYGPGAATTAAARVAPRFELRCPLLADSL